MLPKAVYRGLQGLESAASSVMAVVLMVAGIGLLRDRAWSLKLARYWAYYAFPAAAVSVVLSVRYVLPEVPDASVGGGMVNGAFMLLMLWAYPFLLLRQLPTAAVKAYLDARQHQRQYPGPSSAYPVEPRPTQASSSRADAPPPASSPSLHRSNHSTWRDDPWNDPSSQ